MFFVISGFLITGLLLRDMNHGTRRRQFFDFYARRARRILPAATLVIVASLALAAVLMGDLPQTKAADAAKSAALFYANVRLTHVGGYFSMHNTELFQQYWSLSVEEQFYALWPVIFFGVTAVVALRHRRRVLFGVVAVASAVSFALSNAWVYDDGWLTVAPARAFYLLPSRLWELGIGVMLALVAPRLAGIPARVRRVLLVSGLAAIALAMIGFSSATAFPGWTALLPTLGTAAVLVAGTGGRAPSRITTALERPAPQLLGQYSYSLYLWHWPILLLIVPRLPVGGSWMAEVVVGGSLSLAAAVVTYHLLEDPVRTARPLRVRPSYSLAIGAATVALCVAVAGVVNTRARDGLDGTQVLAAAVDAPGASSGAAVVPTDFVPRGITPALADARPTAGHRCGNHCAVVRGDAPIVALFGDSHAYHFEPTFNAAAATLAVSYRADSLRGCPWFVVVPFADDVAPCRTFRDAHFAQYEADPPAVIVLSSRNDLAYDADDAVWEVAMRKSLRRLPKASKIVVFGETPFTKVATPRCLAENPDDTRPCDRVWPTEINDRLEAIVTSEGATFVDLKSLFCFAGRCPAINGSTLMWADTDHITAEYATLLGPWLSNVVGPMLTPGTPTSTPDVTPTSPTVPKVTTPKSSSRP